MSPKISIVIPTYRREALLQRCLEALAAQRLDRDLYEIVVCDDAHSAATEHLVRYFAGTSDVSLRYIKVAPNHGPAAARNSGWRSARSPIIAFTDDDCVPDPNWLVGGLKAMQRADAAAGDVIVPLSDLPTDYECDCAGLSRGEFVTANCFCRRDVLKAMGGFDERFTTAWREDSDLQFTLLEGGHSIARAVGAVVVHPVRPAAWGVSLHQQRKAFFNALLYAKHPKMYRERIARKPAIYYAIIVAALSGLLALSMDDRWLAAISFVAWLVLLVRLFAVRIQHTSRRLEHVAEIALTSALIPFLSVYWHARGLAHYRVFFLR
jgi:glycosyltransferase involved in cell wall biosynthesis